jgi:hypothetical protein
MNSSTKSLVVFIVNALLFAAAALLLINAWAHDGSSRADDNAMPSYSQ